MYQWLVDLFPLNRSLTGSGVTKTFDKLREISQDICIDHFLSGTNVYDWTIPQVWEISEGWIQHIDTKEIFCSFAECNLHVMGYSEPVDIIIDREELLDHIFSEPDLPCAVPYVTSYYNRAWGFCSSDLVKQNLPTGKYRAFIDSKFSDGEMQIGEALLEGASRTEIFFSSYICHPSMANNELSGPVLQTALIKYISEFYPERFNSYRFVYVPETIGAVAYLSRNLETLKSRIVCGFVLSCVGDDRNYSHVESRGGDTLADKALESALIGKNNKTRYSYLQRGSDERQYCAPGVDLPVCGFCRSKYGEYKEYHTSLDNLDLVSQEGLQGSFEVMKSIIDAFELGLYPMATVLCEPQLGKRGLYPSISKRGSYEEVETRMDILAYADGNNTIFDICIAINKPLPLVVAEIQKLEQHKLIACNYARS